MKSFPRATTFTVAFSFLLLAVGCEVQPTSTVNNNATGGASPTPTPVAATTMPAATPETGGNRVPVTLPVVDALFATDEKFAGELKEKLQLTDAQIDGLRGAAREETAKLRESDDEDYGGTATAAATRAEERMREIVGAEKSGQLTAFVRERWNSGGEGGGNGAGTAAGAAASTGKINAVPTDTRVVVNTPAYRMDLFENGTLVKSYKVGIGYPEFPLPTGTRKASTIIFNPTWTPPDEPWVESGSSKVKVGEKVDAGSALNPLGLIKIPIGSPSLIHGGKSAAKLGTFASHGCVGLTNPQVQDFALQLAKLGGAQVTEEEVKNYAKERKETKNVVLSNPVAVELRYETIVVEDGKLHIYRDVYGYGTNTEENLRAALTAHGVALDQLTEPERKQVLDALTQMSRDARGNATDGAATTIIGTNTNTSRNENTNANANKNNNANDSGAMSKDDKANKNTNAKNANGNTNSSSSVTRAVKGKKEVVIEIAALKGKGYPAPVALDTGSGTTKKSSTRATTRKRA